MKWEVLGRRLSSTMDVLSRRLPEGPEEYHEHYQVCQEYDAV